MNLNRRQFLCNLGALAAAAVVVSVAGEAVPLSADARSVFISQAKIGQLIRGQFFEFWGPVTIEGVDNLHIDECTFIFHNVKSDEYCLTINRCEALTISNSSFDFRDCSAAAYIYFPAGVDGG